MIIENLKNISAKRIIIGLFITISAIAVFAIISIMITNFGLISLAYGLLTGNLPVQTDCRVIKEFGVVNLEEWTSGPHYYYLYDSRNDTSIIHGVDKMLVKGGYMYAQGQMEFYLYSNEIGLYAKEKYMFEGQINGELTTLSFDNQEDMPSYVKINYETGDQEWFYTLDEMSDEDREMFEKDLGFWCKAKKTCYEK